MTRTSDTLLAQLSTTQMNRRRLLQAAAIGAGVAMISPLLAACEVDDDDVVDDADPAAPVADDDDVVDDEVDDVVDDDPEVEDDDVDVPDDEVEGVFGGTLRVVGQTAPAHLDNQATGAVRMFSLHVFEPLVSLTEGFAIQPQLAESWEWDEEGTTLTLGLRDDVIFHNGDTLHAEDVVASVERFMDAGWRGPALALWVDEIREIDDLTVDFVLTEPYAGLLAMLASPLVDLSIWPREHIEGKGPQEFDFDDLVGTGPYQVAELVPDEELVLSRFDDYYNTEGERDGLGGAKIAYFDEIVFTGVAEAGTRVSALLAGDVDVVNPIPAVERQRLEEDPDTEPLVQVVGNYESIAFNHNEGAQWSTDVTFRRAIQAAVDVEDIALLAADGDEALYDLNPSLYRREQEQWWTDVAAETYNQADPERARELLEEAGYDGEEIILIYTAEYSQDVAAATAMTDHLEAAGINFVARGVDTATRYEHYDSPDGWHMMADGMSVRFTPWEWAGTFDCEVRRAGWCHEEMQEVFDQLAVAFDEEEQKRLSDEFQRIHHEDVYAIKLMDRYAMAGLRSDIAGVEAWYIDRFWGVWREE